MTPPEVFDDGPGKIARVMVWDEGQPRQVELRWGLRPREPGGRAVSLLRAENRIFTQRCLIIANDFYLRPGSAPGKRRRRVELITQAPFFCFAGTWSVATRDWPAAFAGLTVDAYPDIAPFQDRHMAVVREESWLGWLSGVCSVEAILRSFPLGSFMISEPLEREPLLHSAKT